VYLRVGTPWAICCRPIGEPVAHHTHNRKYNGFRRWLTIYRHNKIQKNQIYGLETTVTASNHPRVADEDQRILLFQVVRELLFNAVKHAGVTEAHVTLQEEQGGITIRSPAPARR
jgi:signal transduction histidine kinase